MINHDIADLIDARLAAHKDDYLDDQAIRDLKSAVLTDTRASRVTHTLDKDAGTLTLHVDVGNGTYSSTVPVGKRVPHLVDHHQFAEVSFTNDLPPEDKDETHEKRQADHDAAADEAHKASVEAADQRQDANKD